MNNANQNCTTTVDVYTSLGEIQRCACQAQGPKIRWTMTVQGQPVGVTFGINTPGWPRGFALARTSMA